MKRFLNIGGSRSPRKGGDQQQDPNPNASLTQDGRGYGYDDDPGAVTDQGYLTDPGSDSNRYPAGRGGGGGGGGAGAGDGDGDGGQTVDYHTSEQQQRRGRGDEGVYPGGSSPVEGRTDGEYRAGGNERRERERDEPHRRPFNEREPRSGVRLYDSDSVGRQPQGQQEQKPLPIPTPTTTSNGYTPTSISPGSQIAQPHPIQQQRPRERQQQQQQQQEPFHEPLSPSEHQHPVLSGMTGLARRVSASLRTSSPRPSLHQFPTHQSQNQSPSPPIPQVQQNSGGEGGAGGGGKAKVKGGFFKSFASRKQSDEGITSAGAPGDDGEGGVNERKSGGGGGGGGFFGGGRRESIKRFGGGGSSGLAPSQRYTNEEVTRIIGHFVYTQLQDPVKWGELFDFCDKVKRNGSGGMGEGAAEALRKEFKHCQVWRAAYTAGQILKIMFDNTNDSFRRNVASKKFMDSLQDVMNREPKKLYDDERRDMIMAKDLLRKVVSAMAFASKDDSQLSLICKRYNNDIKAPSDRVNGEPILEDDLDFQPPISPRRSRNPRLPRQDHTTNRDPLAEASLARTHAEMLTDALVFTKPEDLDSNEVIKEFYPKCQQSMDYLVQNLDLWRDKAERAARALPSVPEPENDGASPPKGEDTTGRDPSTQQRQATYEERVYKELFEANQSIVVAFDAYDQRMRERTERSMDDVQREVEERSKVEVRFDRSRAVESEVEEGVYQDLAQLGIGGSSSRSPSPLPGAGSRASAGQHHQGVQPSGASSNGQGYLSPSVQLVPQAQVQPQTQSYGAPQQSSLGKDIPRQSDQDLLYPTYNSPQAMSPQQPNHSPQSRNPFLAAMDRHNPFHHHHPQQQLQQQQPQQQQQQDVYTPPRSPETTIPQATNGAIPPPAPVQSTRPASLGANNPYAAVLQMQSFQSPAAVPSPNFQNVPNKQGAYADHPAQQIPYPQPASSPSPPSTPSSRQRLAPSNQSSATRRALPVLPTMPESRAFASSPEPEGFMESPTSVSIGGMPFSARNPYRQHSKDETTEDEVVPLQPSEKALGKLRRFSTRYDEGDPLEKQKELEEQLRMKYAAYAAEAEAERLAKAQAERNGLNGVGYRSNGQTAGKGDPESGSGSSRS